MDKTLTLSEPVQAHGETLTSLTFRAPKGEDLAVCGAPLIFLQPEDPDVAETAVKVDAQAVSKFIARLAGVPPSTVKALSATDWLAAMNVVLDFFGDMASGLKSPVPSRTSSPPTSMSPGSGG